MADAILQPEWSDRYYSFDAQWSESEEMASMRDGSGGEFSIVFSPAGAYVRVHDHESPMSPYANNGPWPGVVDEVPEVFRSCVLEPAFCDEARMPVVTACLWREADDDCWHTGTIDFPEGRHDPDGAQWLLALLTSGTPEAYRKFAEEYYEVPVDSAAVEHIFALRPLTLAVVAVLNSGVSISDLAGDIAAIGYPQ